MNSTSPSAQWAGLRGDILSMVAKCLGTRIDILKLRAVCFSWRSSIPLPPKTPSPYSLIRLPFPIGPNPCLNPNRRGHFLLKESTVYSVKPLIKLAKDQTWIIKVEELSSGKAIFRDPLGRIPFKNNVSAKFPTALNFLDFRVLELGKAYGLEFVEDTNVCDSELEMNEWKSTILIKKIVVTSCLDDIDDTFSIMALHTRGNLGVWRVGDKNWTNVINRNRENSYYDDIVYCNGNFYAIDFTGLVISVDPVSLKVNELTRGYGRGYASGGQYKYLVNSFKGLFRVDKYIGDDCDLSGVPYSEDNCSVSLKVYKLDEGRHVWVKVDELDDNVLFIGDEMSFPVLGKDCYGCKRNSVYFCDDLSFCGYNDDDYNGIPGFDAGIFNLDNRIARPLRKFHGFGEIFWPPPTWLNSKLSSQYYSIESASDVLSTNDLCGLSSQVVP